MRILITGGAGFIGSNLVERLLQELDNEVIVIDNLSTGKKSNIDEYLDKDNFKFIEADITNKDMVTIIKELQVDQIYNLACPASPKYYLLHPIETWESSVLGVRNLLESIKGTHVRMVHSSTSEVYGDALEHPQNEEYWGNVNPIGVRACYDEGKRAAEALIYDFIRQYDVDVRVVRIFNTYGPKMNTFDGRIISNFIMQALKNEDITIYGTGEQTRSFCFIDDTLEFIVKLMNSNNRNNSPINVGNPYELKVNQVAQYVKEKTNSSSNFVYLEAMADDPVKRKPNIDKAKDYIDWEPTISFEDGLNKTIKYFKVK